MRLLPIGLGLALAALAGCERTTGGAAAPAPATAPGQGPAGGSAPAAPPAAAPPAGATTTPATAATPATLDWSSIAPAPEREARLALFGIIRQIDLKRFEDTGWDIVSYEPGAGPTDRLANVFSPVTVMGDTFVVTPSQWLAIFNTVDAWRAERGRDFMARPMPDARYGDGETSTRGNLIFAIVVEDPAEKTLKFVWSPE